MGRARPMHLCGRLVAQRLVRTFEIVKVDVMGKLIISLLGAGIFMQIHFFVLDRAPQAFGEDIVISAPASVHTDLNLRALQPLKVFGAGKVAALIAIPDFRFGL